MTKRHSYGAFDVTSCSILSEWMSTESPEHRVLVIIAGPFGIHDGSQYDWRLPFRLAGGSRRRRLRSFSASYSVCSWWDLYFGPGQSPNSVTSMLYRK